MNLEESMSLALHAAQQEREAARRAGREDLLDLLQAAARDRKIHLSAVRIYLLMLRDMSEDEYRPAKLFYIAGRARMKRQNVWREINALCAAGFLERGPREHQRSPNLFRLTRPPL